MIQLVVVAARAWLIVEMGPSVIKLLSVEYCLLANFFAEQKMSGAPAIAM